MNLAFDLLKVRSLCECQKKAEEKYGFLIAKHLRARLADLREAETVLELPAGGPREVPAKPHNHYVVNLGKGWRLVLRANHARIPTTEDGKVDWSEVTRVMVLRIEDTHA